MLWICGPPGSGKTTLASTYVGTRNVPVLWYQVDEGDGDMASFFYYLGLAGKRANPRKRKPLPLLTSDYVQGVREFSRGFFENLFSRFSPGQVLVFDDYQEIQEKSPLHDLIATGLSRVPEGTTVFFISRGSPPPAFARFRANNRMEMLGWGDLRLTFKECRDIVRFRVGKRRSGEEIRRLHETTDGWVAALMLMLERSDPRGVEPQLLTDRTPGEIFDYFGREIFERTGRSLRNFLVETSFLPDMTAKTAEKLTGQRRAAQLLSHLSRNNHFLVEHPHTEPVYRYHPLFREFLLSRARTALSEKETRAVKQQAAAILVESGRAEDAAELFGATGDYRSLARLIRADAPSLLAQGRNRVLETWLGHIPEKTLQNDPWLLFWLGACQMPFDPAGSMSHTKRSFDLFWKADDPAGTFLSWSLIIDTLVMSMYDFTALDGWIDMFDKITERYPSFPSQDIEARAVASLLGALYMRRADHPDIETWMNKALTIIPKCRDIQIRLQGSLYLLLYFVWIGDIPNARLIIESTRQLIPVSPLYPRIRILFRLFEARFFWLVAQFDDSIRSVEKGLEIARSSGMHSWDFLLLTEGASASLGKGNVSSASEYLRRMSPILNTDQVLLKAYYYHLSSWLASLEGDKPLAISRNEKALELITECGAPCGITLDNLHLASLNNEVGKPEESKNHLRKASYIARGMRSPILDYQYCLAEADWYFTMGEEESGCRSLRNALSIGREKGYFHHDNWSPSLMVRLCMKALQEGIEVPYVQEIVRKRSLVPASPPLDIEAWPWPVRIYTLGRFGILRDGKPLAFSRKVQKRPLSLLKALVAFGGRAVREDQLTDAVWPEFEGDAAARSFSVAVTRLRRLLGHEEAVQRREGLSSLDSRICWVDAFAFERIHGQAASLGEKGLCGEGVCLSEKAAGLYRGPFLEGDAAYPWTVSMRERLRSKFLRTMARLGAHWQQVEQWEKARECYEKGLEVDNLAEEFYQGLMTSFLEQGRKAEAIAVYDRLKKVLAPLGVSPSPKTSNLVESLLSVSHP